MLKATTIGVNGYWNTRLQQVVESGMRQSKAQIVSEALECTFLPEGVLHSGKYWCIPLNTAMYSIFALSI